MVTVFAHPGQRSGLMIESLLMILVGSLLGVLWSLLGLFLSNLVVHENRSAAYTIRGLFLVVSVLVHGFVRSSSPRLFNFVLFMLIACIITLQFPNDATTLLFTDIYIPILLAAGVLLVVNFTIFPELSSSHLGSATIRSISEATETLNRATYWFITPGGDSAEAKENRLHRIATVSSAGAKQHAPWYLYPFTKQARKKLRSRFPNPFHGPKTIDPFSAAPLNLTSIAQLAERKIKLRNQLRICRTAQEEVNFEISLSSLRPASMKNISTDCMTSLIQEVITLIAACENKFVLLGSEEQQQQQTTRTTHHVDGEAHVEGKRKSKKKRKKSSHVDHAKPIREIEAGSAELLTSIVEHIQEPVIACQSSLQDAVHLLTVCLAYTFDVKTLPSGAMAPTGMSLQEVDLLIDKFADDLHTFDLRSAESLKKAAMHRPSHAVDLMPRMETFLISSFILAFRQSASQIMAMLRHARSLVEQRQTRKNRSTIWLPNVGSFREWLSTGGEANVTTAPEITRQADADSQASPLVATPATPCSESQGDSVSKQMNDEEAQHEKETPQPDKKKKSGLFSTSRRKLADAIEWAQKSGDLVYASKLSIAVMLVSWPALIPSLNDWYTEVRGIWAPMQLILVFELAIGTSFLVFFVRLFGVAFGGIIGYLSFEIARGNKIGMVVILLIGIAPSIYIQVCTKYVKAGMISIVSMTVVALSTVSSHAPAYEVFYKRLVAFLIGGLAAMLIEIIIYPVRARDRLVTSLSSSVRYIETMQAAVAVGIDEPEKPNFRSPLLHSRFNRAKEKAQDALTDAEMFLPFCLTEPRLKGSFRPLAPIYAEIIYVLHQIIDRMTNVVQLRRAYGSSILEDLNPKVYTSRRNVAASCTMILFCVNEALTTWLPLPQFLPSARTAQLRLVNRVRELLIADSAKGSTSLLRKHLTVHADVDESTVRMITQRKFLSWNASSAGQMEIIEYLEELIDLVKLLVGVNAFRSGVLETPTYIQYMAQMKTPEEQEQVLEKSVSQNAQDMAHSGGRPRAATIGDRATTLIDGYSETDNAVTDIPLSLQRVGSRIRRNNNVARRRAFTVGESSI